MGSDALEKIKAMPYCLMQAVPRFGFKKNDAFALRIGVEKTAPVRIKAVIQYVLNDWIFNSGNSYIETQELFRLVNKYLNDELDYNLYRQMIEEPVERRHYHSAPNNFVSMPSCTTGNHACQTGKGASKRTTANRKFDINQIKRYLEQFETESTFVFDADQKGHHPCAFQPLSIITGGPGTGKQRLSGPSFIYISNFITTIPLGSIRWRW